MEVFAPVMTKELSDYIKRILPLYKIKTKNLPWIEEKYCHYGFITKFQEKIVKPNLFKNFFEYSASTIQVIHRLISWRSTCEYKTEIYSP